MSLLIALLMSTPPVLELPAGAPEPTCQQLAASGYEYIEPADSEEVTFEEFCLDF